MTRIILAAVLFLGCIGIAAAGSCRNNVQATPVVFATPLILPSYYPVYGQQGASDEVLKAILAELKAIREELGGRSPEGGELTMQVITSQACVRCHQEGKDPKGSDGGFVLADKDGKLVEMDKGTKRFIWNKVRLKGEGKMPPDRNLSTQALTVIEKFTAGKP